MFIFSGNRNATDVSGLAEDYLSNVRYMAARSILETAKDFLDTTIFAWFVQPYQLFSAGFLFELDVCSVHRCDRGCTGFALYLSVQKMVGQQIMDEAETPRLIKDLRLDGRPGRSCSRLCRSSCPTGRWNYTIPTRVMVSIQFPA